MALRLSGIFGDVFFVSKSPLGIEGQKKLEKFAILTRKPWTHAGILIYRTWPIENASLTSFILNWLESARAKASEPEKLTRAKIQGVNK